MQNLLVNGLVSHRDQSPRIHISDGDKINIQMGAEEAIHLAMNIIKMAEATMADALLIRWAQKNMKDKGLHFATVLMQEFRDFRAELELETIYATLNDHRDLLLGKPWPPNTSKKEAAGWIVDDKKALLKLANRLSGLRLNWEMDWQ